MLYEKPSDVIFHTCLNVKKSEKVLIIADKGTEKIGRQLYFDAQELAHADLEMIPVGKQSGEEPPAATAKKMLHYDVILAPTTQSLTHTKAVQVAKKNARIATLPGITEQIMKESLMADYKKITAFNLKLGSFLKHAKHIQITTRSGTNLELSVRDRAWILDNGLIHQKGIVGNLPAGEVFTAPVEGTTHGILVVDSFKHEHTTFAQRGTKIFLKEGEAVEITDKRSVLADYFKRIKNATNIAEIGIGTNDEARIIGNILQDEKVKGTVHIAFGNNSSIGGKVYSELHIDTILQEPNVVVDGKVLMRRGNFAL